MAVGTPEFIASVDDSFTGGYLRDVTGIVPDPDAEGDCAIKSSDNGRHSNSLENGSGDVKIADILAEHGLNGSPTKPPKTGTRRRRRRRRRAASRSN